MHVHSLQLPNQYTATFLLEDSISLNYVILKIYRFNIYNPYIQQKKCKKDGESDTVRTHGNDFVVCFNILIKLITSDSAHGL